MGLEPNIAPTSECGVCVTSALAGNGFPLGYLDGSIIILQEKFARDPITVSMIPGLMISTSS